MISKKAEYRLWLESSDPQIFIQLPAEILKDLVERSLENGYSLESELCKRLARSLETELETMKEDDLYAERALEQISNSHHLAFRDAKDHKINHKPKKKKKGGRA